MQLYNDIKLCHQMAILKRISEIKFNILDVYKYKFTHTFSKIEKKH